MGFEFFVSLAAIGIALFALFKVQDMSETVQKLREDLAGKRALPTAAPKSDTSPMLQKPDTFPALSTQPSGIDRLLNWYKHEWPLKTGALFILLGFVWLVTYAFLNNWIGPMGRITFGIIVGSVVLYLGELRIRSVITQGITLVGLGAGIITVTIYAAQSVYSMFPPIVALLFLAIVMILTAFISLRHNILSLSLASLLIGGLAPLLIGGEGRDILMLYSYLLTVVIGVIWIARHQKWSMLTLIALGIVSLYSLSFFPDSARYVQAQLLPHEFLGLRFFAVTFTSLFFFATLASIVTNKKASVYDLTASAAVGLFTYGWINCLVLPEYKSLITLFAALSYSLGSYVVFVRTRIREAVYIYTGVSVVLLAIATSLTFDGPILVIAFSLEAAMVFLIASLSFDEQVAKRMLFYYIIPLILSIPVIFSASWNTGIMHSDFVALSVVTLSFLCTGLYLYSVNTEAGKPMHQAAVFLVVVGAIYALILLWKVAHGLLSPDTLARLLTLSVYSIVGLGAYVYGETNKRRIIHKFGLVLLLFVVGRLLIVEIWDMELTIRIITFFVIGLLFIASVLLRKNSQKL